MKLMLDYTLEKKKLTYLKTQQKKLPKQNTEGKNNFKNEKSISKLWDNFRHHNKYVTVALKGEGGGQKTIESIMTEFFPKFVQNSKSTDPRISKKPKHKKPEGN